MNVHPEQEFPFFSISNEFWIVFFLCLFSSNILAQNNDIRFNHISIEEGLSQTTIFSIAQDHYGFMWFATRDGLNKYDGDKFTVFRPQPDNRNAISDLGVRRILVDRSGRLWIVSLNGFIDCFDPDSGRFYNMQIPAANPNERYQPKARCVAEGPEGKIWIGTVDANLYFYDKKRKQLTYCDKEKEISSELHLHSMIVDKAGNIWLGTWEGLIKVDSNSGKCCHYKYQANNFQSLSGNAVFDISEDKNGDLWIATADGGLSFLNVKENKFQNYHSDPKNKNSASSNRIFSVCVDSKSNIWIGTADTGLDIFNPNEKVFKHYIHDPQVSSTISDGSIRCIFEDQSGTMWIGSANSGLSYCNIKNQSFKQIIHVENTEGSLSHNAILSLHEDHTGTLWVGTDGGGLNRRLPGQDKFDYFFVNPGSFGSNSISAIYEDRKGTIWIGTDPGSGSSAGNVITFNRNTNHFTMRKELAPEAASVSVFFEDSGGDFWIGTYYDGVKRVDSTTKQITDYRFIINNKNSICGNKILSINEDKAGNIWFGTYDSGISKYEKSSNTFSHYQNEPGNKQSLSNNAVWCIYPDDNFLWIGTWGGGLNRFDFQNETFRIFTIEDGLPTNIIYNILPDKNNNLWMGTNRGICRFNTQSFKSKNYDNSNGVINYEINKGAYCTGQDGKFYFGGSKGITIFSPDSIKDNQRIPGVLLTDFTVFDTPLKLDHPIYSTEEIILSYKQNFFSIEFAALDYTAPGKNQYSYSLEGVNEDWINNGNKNFASYTNIDPGEYIFHVKGSNNDGVWNEEGTSLRIIITPPFWQTWWFRILLIISFAFILFAFHRYRLNKLLEVERTRVRIARDLHDEVSATLTGIVYFVNAISKEIGKRTTPLLKNLLSLITESATEAQESMSDIIWSINPDNDKWEVLMPKFRRFASDLCESKDIQYKIHISEIFGRKSLQMEKRRHIWLIFKEIVTNAVKHSECSEVTVNISFDDNIMKLEIADNGNGFDENKPKDRNGIKNIKTRTAVLSGKVKLETQIGKGTKWDISIPI